MATKGPAVLCAEVPRGEEEHIDWNEMFSRTSYSHGRSLGMKIIFTTIKENVIKIVLC